MRPPGALVTSLLVFFGLPSMAVPRNHAPSPGALGLTTDEDVRVDGVMLATDEDRDALVFKLAGSAAHGLATVSADGHLSYLGKKDFHGEDTFVVEVSDGKVSAKSKVNVHVVAVNDAPVARAVSLSTREDTEVRGKSAASDVDGDALTFRVHTGPAHGTAQVDPHSGALTYQASPDTSGPDVFGVEVSDGVLTTRFDVAVAVSPVNDAPVAAAGTFSADEDTQLEGTLAARDVDGDSLTFKVRRPPKYGELTLDPRTGAFTYLPRHDVNGPDNFSFEVSDGHLRSEALASLDIRPVNDAPTLAPLALSTLEDRPAEGKLVAHDVDSGLSFSLRTLAAHGQARVDSRTGVVNYQPAPDFNGTDTFSVEVSDGSLTARADVTVAIAAVNDAPVAAALVFTLDEDGKLDELIAASDVDGDALTWTLTKAPAHGLAAVDVNTGKLTYSPARDFFGDDAMTIEVSDRQLKVTAPVRVQVRAVNDAPVVRSLALAAPEDTPAHGAIIAFDVDSPLSFRVSKAPQHGEARVDARGSVAWQPAPDFNGSDTFTIEVSDGALSVDCFVTVAVAAVNDAPVVAASSFTVDEDARLEVALPISDVDADALATRLVRSPSHGVATVELATGRLTYVPAKDFNGEDQLSIEVSDGKLKTTSLVSVRVSPVNDAPVTSPLSLSTNEDTACRGAVMASDVDRDGLRYRVTSPPRHGQASVDGATGAVSYAPAPNTSGPDAFVIEVSDGALTATSAVTVAVAAVDDPPVVSEATLELNEDVPAEGKLPATEADGERLTFRLLSTPRLGVAQLVDAATGSVRFVPGADLNGDDELRFDVTDGKTTVGGTLKLHVAAVNDAPTLAALELTTAEDQAVDGRLVGKDVDGDVLTFSLVSVPSFGSATLEATSGQVRFVPARDANGQVVFKAVVSDGKLSSAPAAVTVTVQPQNDAPVAHEGRLATDEDEVLAGTLQAVDIDRDPLVFAVVGIPSHGTVRVVDPAEGRFEYTPAPNYSGQDGFTFSVTDPAGATSQASVMLTVKEVNDAPIAVSDNIVAPFRGTISGRLKGYDRETRQVTFRVLDKSSNAEFRLLDPRTGEFTISTEGRTTNESTVRFEVDDGSLTSKPGQLVVQIRSL